jgi:hypothetical protein
MEVLHELSRSALIAQTYAVKTASQIERLVVRHKYIEATSNTLPKTR